MSELGNNSDNNFVHEPVYVPISNIVFVLFKRLIAANNR